LKTYRPEHLGLGHNLTIDGQVESDRFLDLALEKNWQMKEEISKQIDNNVPEKEIALQLAERLTRYGLFGHFPIETLAGFTSLIIKRSLEE